jgi:kinesin family protein C1
MRNLRTDGEEKALTLFQAPGDAQIAPKTPSHIPVLSKQESFIATPATTPCKTPKTSPQKPIYLTKDSNTPAFIAWDVRGRLEDMEAMYSVLRDTLNGTSLERNGLEEAVALYKARSTSLQ